MPDTWIGFMMEGTPFPFRLEPRVMSYLKVRLPAGFLTLCVEGGFPIHDNKMLASDVISLVYHSCVCVCVYLLLCTSLNFEILGLNMKCCIVYVTCYVM